MKKFILMFLFVVALTSCKKDNKQMMEKTSDSNNVPVEEMVNQQNDSTANSQSMESNTESNESTESVVDETINNDIDENK